MVIIGTGGLGKEILGILIEDNFPDEIAFYDEDINAPDFLYEKYKVIKNIHTLENYFLIGDRRFITGIGNPRIREKLTLQAESCGGELYSVISSKASNFHYNEKYTGVIIQQGVAISHNVKIGKGAAIHVNATIGHSAVIGNFVNIGPNVNIIGPVHIGDYTYISVQAIIMPHLKIGKNVVVTAGKTVDCDLEDYSTY